MRCETSIPFCALSRAGPSWTLVGSSAFAVFRLLYSLFELGFDLPVYFFRKEPTEFLENVWMIRKKGRNLVDNFLDTAIRFFHVALQDFLKLAALLGFGLESFIDSRNILDSTIKFYRLPTTPQRHARRGLDGGLFLLRLFAHVLLPVDANAIYEDFRGFEASRMNHNGISFDGRRGLRPILSRIPVRGRESCFGRRGIIKRESEWIFGHGVGAQKKTGYSMQEI